MRKSIDTYLKSIMHDNEDYIRDNYDSFAVYILDKAINNTGWREFFDDSELDETGEPSKEQIDEVKKYLYQYYDSTFQMFEVWHSCSAIFTCVGKFRTLTQAKEYCNKEVEGLEFCGDWPESNKINTTKKLEVYDGYPLALNEMDNPTAIYEPVYSTGYYYINAIDT